MTLNPSISESMQPMLKDSEFSQANKKLEKLEKKLVSSKIIFSQKLKIKRLKFKKHIFGKNRLLEFFTIKKIFLGYNWLRFLMKTKT